MGSSGGTAGHRGSTGRSPTNFSCLRAPLPGWARAHAQKTCLMRGNMRGRAIPPATSALDKTDNSSKQGQRELAAAGRADILWNGCVTNRKPLAAISTPTHYQLCSLPGKQLTVAPIYTSENSHMIHGLSSCLAHINDGVAASGRRGYPLALTHLQAGQLRSRSGCIRTDESPAAGR